MREQIFGCWILMIFDEGKIIGLFTFLLSL